MRDKTGIERADTTVAEAAAPLRDSVAVRVLGALSEVADQPQLISLCAATLAAGLVAGNARLARTGGRMLAAELLATAMKRAIKHRVDRTRPRVVDDGGDYAMRAGHDRDSAMTSFPSGHTAGAVAVARALGRDYPGARLPAHAAAAAIAAVQIPRCQHYPTDLAAGALIGLVAEGMVRLAENALAAAVRPGGRPDQPGSVMAIDRSSEAPRVLNPIHASASAPMSSATPPSVRMRSQ